MEGYYIGVDVGTGSARACLVESSLILAQHEIEIPREELKPDHITQSSTFIWNSICTCIKEVILKANINGKDVRAIGFDATCSLVVIDKNSKLPMAVGPDLNNNDQNIILWMDHRATKEADIINATNDRCLKYVGGKMSVEMELPKIKWLKGFRSINNAIFFDLPDYLTFKATDKETRSLCSTVCKQGLLPANVDESTEGWSKEFLHEIDVDELIENDFESLGGSLTNTGSFLSAGQPVGYLSKTSAYEMGLSENTLVSSGIIDAYAGYIGTVAAKPFTGQIIESKMTERLAMVAGTSTCHIIMSDHEIMVPGVWGPYKDVMIPDYWAAEGGQSCTGALLQHILTTHPSYHELIQLTKGHQNPFDYLNKLLQARLEKMSQKSVSDLTKDIFVYGDFHGNRSPLADPDMRATVIGQTLDTSIESLALLYLASCEFIALQTRHIIDTMVEAGHIIKTIYMSGSQVNNELLVELMVKATGLDIIIPEHKSINFSSTTSSSVAYGSAILGMCTYKTLHTEKSHNKKEILWEVMNEVTPKGKLYEAKRIINAYDQDFLNVKYEIYLDMIKTQKKYRSMMKRFGR